MAQSRFIKTLISGCRLEVFCHATEEEEKVLQAMKNVLPEGLRENKKAETERLSGLYKNPIVKFSIRLGGRESRDFVEHLKNNLSEEDRKRLVSEAPERTEGSGFFFRLDKQEAYRGRLKLAGSGGGDAIGVRLTIETFGKDVLEEEVAKLFLGCSHDEMRKEFGK